VYSFSDELKYFIWTHIYIYSIPYFFIKKLLTFGMFRIKTIFKNRQADKRQEKNKIAKHDNVLLLQVSECQKSNRMTIISSIVL